jgi:hypothetical protein
LDLSDDGFDTTVFHLKQGASPRYSISAMSQITIVIDSTQLSKFEFLTTVLDNTILRLKIFLKQEGFYEANPVPRLSIRNLDNRLFQVEIKFKKQI